MVMISFFFFKFCSFIKIFCATVFVALDMFKTKPSINIKIDIKNKSEHKSITTSGEYKI